MENHEKDQVLEYEEKDQVPQYERPSVVDYGTLVDITSAGSFPNADVPQGANNTAFSPA